MVYSKYMNWVDIVIILFVLFGIVQGFFKGFVAQIFQVGAFIAAFLFALWIYPSFSGWLESQIHVSISLAQPLALAIIFFVTAFIFQKIAAILHKIMAPMLGANVVNKGAGAAVGGLEQLLIVSFLLTLLVTLPLPTGVKAAIDSSQFGKPLIHVGLKTEQYLSEKFGGDALRSLGYRIVGSEETTTTALNYTVADPKVDLEGEAKMVLITNEVRKEAKKPALKFNNGLRIVAENYGKEMLAKGYFSHISPDGKDVVVRVREANIVTLAVGENLANAATVEIAQVGLMASPGHRANILSDEFTEFGIGVLDAGSHGKMIVEVFAKIY